MKISFIVVALNAAGSLPLLLDDLRAQTLPPKQIELLLVDSASEDGTLAVVRASACWAEACGSPENVGSSDSRGLAGSASSPDRPDTPDISDKAGSKSGDCAESAGAW